jgi:arylsulfatase A-like enzyme
MRENREQPFFLYLPFNAPHSPFQARKEDYDRFAHIADPYKRIYCAMIYALDQAVGEIVQEVRDLGLAEHTIICFASDNGGATYTLGTDNAPLKGGKMSAFEGGVNIPMMISWPGKIAPETVFHAPVSLMDLFATAAAAADADLPEDRSYDGVDLLPFLSGARPDQPHEALFWRSGYNKSVRSGDWKLLLNELDGDTLLYDLSQDKYEQTDAARRRPEVVRDLIRQLHTWEKELAAPRWPGVMDYHFRIGTRVYRFPV